VILINEMTKKFVILFYLLTKKKENNFTIDVHLKMENVCKKIDYVKSIFLFFNLIIIAKIYLLPINQKDVLLLKINA